MRLFIAVNFSDEVKKVLNEAILDLSSQAKSGNFTRPENLHLTLAFIGESENISDIIDVIDSVRLTPFNITVSGTGRFGDLYWVGIKRSYYLNELANYIRNGLRDCGFKIEERDFKPHITIARQVVSDKAVSISINETKMTVSRVSLMKSERLNGKLVYNEVYGRVL